MQEQQTIDFDGVFLDAKRKFFEVKPGLEVSTQKQLELLMNKFKEMSSQPKSRQKRDVIKDEHINMEKTLKER